MTIREMTVEDVSPVAAIEREDSLTPWDENGLFTWLIRQDALFLVAEEDGEVAGYVGLVLIPWESEILNITVRRASRRRGLAQALLTEAFSRLPELGVTVVHLEVRAGSAGAIALYEKNGFERVGLRRGYYTAPTEDAVLMTAKLPGAKKKERHTD